MVPSCLRPLARVVSVYLSALGTLAQGYQSGCEAWLHLQEALALYSLGLMSQACDPVGGAACGCPSVQY
jgi:hypothetical protein